MPSDSENEDDLLYNFSHEPTEETWHYKGSPLKRQRRTSSTCTTADEEPLVQLPERTIFTAGRPPWYDSQGQLKEPFVIGICGGSASGKTSVAVAVIEGLDVPWVSLLCMDSFYKALSPEEHKLAKMNKYNFDCPEAFNLDLIAETIRRLKEGKSVEIPVYNFTTHTLENTKKKIYGANVVIFEGIFSFLEKFREMMDIKIFVDTDADVRLARRLQRDTLERGRDVDGVLKQYNKFVKPAYDMYIEEFKRHADIIVPKGRENSIGINLIITHIHRRLQERGLQILSELKQVSCKEAQHPESLIIKSNKMSINLLQNNSTLEIESIVSNIRELMSSLVNHAMNNQKYNLDKIDEINISSNHEMSNMICVVSLLKAQQTLNLGFSNLIKGACGKIIVITNKDTSLAELHKIRLPKDIKKHKVLLMDTLTKTGAAAIMAIRVLLDHDVPQSCINLLSIAMTTTSVQAIAYAFPTVKIWTTDVVHEYDHNFNLLLETVV